MPNTFHTLMLILAVSVVCILIVVYEYVTPNPVIAETPVETVEFQKDTVTVYIQTTDEALAVDLSDVIFVKGNDYTLIERKDKNSMTIIGKSPYTVYIPADHAKEISQNYAKTFGETLVFKTED